MEGILTKEMYDLAWNVAKARTLRNAAAGRTPNHAYGGARFDIDLPGAIAEAFVAQTFDIPWGDTPFSERGEPDVGSLDVRSTSYRNGGLILHEDSPDDRPFVLVIVPTTERGQPLTIPGWCYGREGKLPRYWRRDVRKACFIVPQRDLRDPHSLGVGLPYEQVRLEG